MVNFPYYDDCLELLAWQCLCHEPQRVGTQCGTYEGKHYETPDFPQPVDQAFPPCGVDAGVRRNSCSIQGS